MTQSTQMDTAAKRPDLSLVVPCYNEQAVLRHTVRELLSAFHDARVDLDLILVDNGSTDETGAIIDELLELQPSIRKVQVPVNEGYGLGVLRGFESCQGALVGVVHADGQVEARDVVRVYDTARRAGVPTLVKVRRRFRMDGVSRKIISTFFNILANVLFPRLGSIDINASPKIFPAEYLPRMQLQSSDWFIDCEMMIKARRMGLRVIEFNVLAQARTGGRSHVNVRACWEFVLNLLKYRVGMAPGANSISAERRGEVTS